MRAFDQTLVELENFYTSFPMGEFPLWKLIERGFLFKLFQQKEEVFIDTLSERVNLVLLMRKRMANFIQTPLSISGRLLAFYPYLTMYDGVAEQVSNGFFDSDDVPPPEFWLSLKDEVLLAFIPDEFIKQANQGVENSMSGCLEWLSDR